MTKKNKTAEPQPNRKIKAVVDMMFDDIPYSEEVVKAQDKIKQVLNTEFDKIKDGRHEDEALEELLGKYGRLSQMAELAGYPAESAAKWRGETEAVDLRPLKIPMCISSFRLTFSMGVCYNMGKRESPLQIGI